MRAKHWQWMMAILLLLRCLALCQADSAVCTPAPLSTDDVVRKLVERNVERAQALRAYRGTRLYRVHYQGFSGARTAEMAVEVTFESPATKEFTVLSATGSRLLIDRVLRKLIQSEREALDAETQRRTALNRDNYEFTLLGCESTASGFAYVLAVEPKRKDKFLYRGQVWVDAGDFAVVRLKVAPARNPSFWIKHTQVEHEYSKVGGFWLPARNRSVSAIRLGGQAELTIDYRDYRITAEPEGKLPIVNQVIPPNPMHGSSKGLCQMK